MEGPSPKLTAGNLSTSNKFSINFSPFLLLLCPILVHLTLTDHLGTVGISNYVNIASLLFLLFFVPDLTASRLKKARNQNLSELTTPMLLTLYALLLLTGLSFILPAGISTFLPPVAAVLAGSYFFVSRSEPISLKFSWPFFLASLFCYLLLYGQGVHNLLYTEALTQGTMHLDILMHSSIAESISSFGVPSTSLDGSPYVHYHWFSHVVMGGLAKLTGMSSLGFYNLFYPVVFIPLFLKFLFRLSQRISNVLQLPEPGLLALLIMLAGIFAIPFLAYRVAQPFSGESLLVSLLLVYAHYDAILLFSRSTKQSFSSFLAFYALSLFLLTLVAFAKISTGFVWIGTFGILCFWKLPVKRFLLTIPGFIIIGLLTLKFVFLSGRADFQPALFTRLRNLLDVLGGGAFLLMPLLCILLFLLYFRPSIKPLRSWVKGSGLIEVIIAGTVVAWGLSILGAAFTSIRRSDVMLFLLASILLCYPLLVVLWGDLLSKHYPKFKLLTYLVILLLVFTHIRLLFPFRKTQLLFSNNEPASTEQRLRRQLIQELSAARNLSGKNTVVFIPSNNDWFYATTDSVRLRLPLSVPAISGLSMIGGIPAEQFEQGPTNIYTLSNYLKNPSVALGSEADALNRAVQLGYTKVLHIRREEDGLKKTLLSVAQNKK